MKKILLLFTLGATLLSCPEPRISVNTINAPSIQGITSGYFTELQVFSVQGGYGGVFEYSLDGGNTWSSYSGPVQLQPESRQLFEVVARQYDQEGNVSGNTAVISVYMDAEPYSVFTLDNITEGTYLADKTIYITKMPNAVVEYSLDNGSTWTEMETDGSFIELTDNGSYALVVRQLDSEGAVLDESTPLNIEIAKDAIPTATIPAEGRYNTSLLLEVSTIYDLTIQYSTDGGTSWADYTTPVILFGEADNPTLPVHQEVMDIQLRLKDADGNTSTPSIVGTYDFKYIDFSQYWSNAHFDIYTDDSVGNASEVMDGAETLLRNRIFAEEIFKIETSTPGYGLYKPVQQDMPGTFDVVDDTYIIAPDGTTRIDFVQIDFFAERFDRFPILDPATFQFFLNNDGEMYQIVRDVEDDYGNSYQSITKFALIPTFKVLKAVEPFIYVSPYGVKIGDDNKNYTRVLYADDSFVRLSYPDFSGFSFIPSEPFRIKHLEFNSTFGYVGSGEDIHFNYGIGGMAIIKHYRLPIENASSVYFLMYPLIGLGRISSNPTNYHGGTVYTAYSDIR